MLKHLKGRFFGLAEIFADSERKALGLCIFCRKNSFQGLGAINLGLIPKYCRGFLLGDQKEKMMF